MIDEARYVRWSIERTPPLAKERLGADAVARRVAEDVRGTLRERTDPGWLARYRQACPVPGVDASAYALREVRLGDDVAVVAGIHFYGGDVARPFVGVFAQTRDLTGQERLDATVVLLDAFAGFAPVATWWWVAGDEELGAPAIADQRLLLGAIADLTRRPVARTDLPFALRRDDRGETYAAYRALFDAFLAAHPAWVGRIERTAREDYEACAGAGGLFVAEHEARLVGVFAARPGEVRGVPGWLVEEELLAEGWRGRGLAPLLQRSALARLDAHAHPLVLGTIDAGNAPSRRTARRVGRTDVGGWWFVPDPRRPLASWLPSGVS
jgi:GNAT superfamily N-acetyltransferase